MTGHATLKLVTMTGPRRERRATLRRRVMDEQAEDRMMLALQLSLSSLVKRAVAPSNLESQVRL